MPTSSPDFARWILDGEPASRADIVRYYELTAAEWATIGRAALTRTLDT